MHLSRRWKDRSQIGPPRFAYRDVLASAFAFFKSARLVAYLPTIWALWTRGDSSQHSLWTWLTWLGANATMAAWLADQNGGRLNRAAAVSLGNATMCLAITVLIVAFRSS